MDQLCSGVVVADRLPLHDKDSFTLQTRLYIKEKRKPTTSMYTHKDRDQKAL